MRQVNNGKGDVETRGNTSRSSEESTTRCGVKCNGQAMICRKRKVRTTDNTKKTSHWRSSVASAGVPSQRFKQSGRKNSIRSLLSMTLRGVEPRCAGNAKHSRVSNHSATMPCDNTSYHALCRDSTCLEHDGRKGGICFAEFASFASYTCLTPWLHPREIPRVDTPLDPTCAICLMPSLPVRMGYTQM